MEFKHISVLMDESIELLRVKDGGVYADGTLGGGGHSEKILEQNCTCRVLGIDRDAEAIEAAKKRLEPYAERVTYVHDNFKNINRIMRERGIGRLSGAVIDLGVSSYQLDNAERGFSYMHDAPLDMRMDRDAESDAYKVINEYSEAELTRIFYEYGEEKWSKRIASFIAQRRKRGPVRTTGELCDIIKAAIPAGARAQGGHPAKRVFQAVRIEVNGELDMLPDALCDFVKALDTGGRLAVITFHSLEDRLVKKTFASLAKGCICPKDFPVCVCGRKPTVRIVNTKPILPGSKELGINPRSKSAKLRVVEKLENEYE